MSAVLSAIAQGTVSLGAIRLCEGGGAERLAHKCAVFRIFLGYAPAGDFFLCCKRAEIEGVRIFDYNQTVDVRFTEVNMWHRKDKEWPATPTNIHCFHFSPLHSP